MTRPKGQNKLHRERKKKKMPASTSFNNDRMRNGNHTAFDDTTFRQLRIHNPIHVLSPGCPKALWQTNIQITRRRRRREIAFPSPDILQEAISSFILSTDLLEDNIFAVAWQKPTYHCQFATVGSELEVTVNCKLLFTVSKTVVKIKKMIVEGNMVGKFCETSRGLSDQGRVISAALSEAGLVNKMAAWVRTQYCLTYPMSTLELIFVAQWAGTSKAHIDTHWYLSNQVSVFALLKTRKRWLLLKTMLSLTFYSLSWRWQVPHTKGNTASENKTLHTTTTLAYQPVVPNSAHNHHGIKSHRIFTIR